MGSSDNGIRQSPFSDAWPTPDVGGQGLNGIGGGIDTGGTNGIIASPWSNPACPAPGGEETACPELGQPAPKFITVDGQTSGTSVDPQEITSSRNTIDRK